MHIHTHIHAYTRMHIRTHTHPRSLATREPPVRPLLITIGSLIRTDQVYRQSDVVVLQPCGIPRRPGTDPGAPPGRRPALGPSGANHYEGFADGPSAGTREGDKGAASVMWPQVHKKENS